MQNIVEFCDNKLKAYQEADDKYPIKDTKCKGIYDFKLKALRIIKKCATNYLINKSANCFERIKKICIIGRKPYKETFIEETFLNRALATISEMNRTSFKGSDVK